MTTDRKPGDPLTWVGGEHRFVLGIGELRAIQRNCDAGPERVMRRLALGSDDWRIDDIVEPLRLGLIGAGEMSESDAGPYLAKMWQQHGALQLKGSAFVVMVEALTGPEDDPVGKAGAGEATTTPTDDGASPASTETGS